MVWLLAHHSTPFYTVQIRRMDITEWKMDHGVKILGSFVVYDVAFFKIIFLQELSLARVD